MIAAVVLAGSLWPDAARPVAFYGTLGAADFAVSQYGISRGLMEGHPLGGSTASRAVLSAAFVTGMSVADVKLRRHRGWRKVLRGAALLGKGVAVGISIHRIRGAR